MHDLALIFLILGSVCALILGFDVCRRPQPMAIMNVVWPTCALFGGIWVSWLYFNSSRAPRRGSPHKHHADDHTHRDTPFPIAVANDTLHCGAGCTLGDIIAELLLFLIPSLPAYLGFNFIFTRALYAGWVLDFLFAFGLGIVFQYMAIVPMRGLGVRAGLLAALKADTLSLICWQVGMFGFMALAQLWLGPAEFGSMWHANSVEFWFLMQCAMTCGYVVAYPANWWLVRRGIKAEM